MALDSRSVRDGLLGVSLARSGLVLTLAGALSIGSVLLGATARAQGWMAVFDGRLSLLVLFVLVVGSAVAAANAYWNDGLLLSWLLVFGSVLGWLWIVFVQGPVFFDVAIVPIAWAALTALVVGTVGYVIGRRRRLHARTKDEGKFEWPLEVLVGRELGQRGRWVVVSAMLFVLGSGVIYGTRPFVELPFEGVMLFELFYPTGVLAANTWLGTLVVLGWIGLAMWPAYRGAGLLVSWGIVFGPMFGAILTGFVLGGTSGVGPLLDATFAFLAALIFVVILGTGGFLLGIALRRVVGSPESRRPPDDVKA